MQPHESKVYPFPGLRSYNENESDSFFGREREVEDCLNILQQNKILTLSGDQGVGKSSLIRAGIVPRLKKGFSGQAGRDWEVCYMRPGIAPVENLSYSLSDGGALYLTGKAKSTDHKAYKSSFEDKRDLGLVEIYSKSEIFEKKNLLIVVDQLEDLFKFQNIIDADSEPCDQLFIELINRSWRYKETALYFILAVDKTYTGKLNNYERFTEVINNTLYNLATLNSEGILSIAEKTFHKRNVQLDVSLIDQISDFLKDNPSQLPSIQYLLRKIYKEYAVEIDRNIEIITIEKVNELGGLNHAVSSGLTSFFKGLDNEERLLFEIICRGATFGTADHNTGYYQKMEYISALSQTELGPLTLFIKKINSEFQDLIDLFKSQIRGKHALKQKVLAPNDILCFKYSSIQDWSSFKEWYKSEQYNYNIYFENYKKAQKFPKESLLTSTSLELATDWLKDKHINFTWAQKYGLDFPKTVHYIEQSIEAFNKYKIKQESIKRDVEMAKKKSKNLKAIVVAVVIIALSIGVYQRHTEAVKSKILYNEMNQKASDLDAAIKIKDQKEKDILEFRRIDSLENVQRQREQRMHIDLIQSQLMSQNKLISLRKENERKTKALEEKSDRITSDSIRAIQLIQDAYMKEQFTVNSQQFINLKDSLSLLLYSLNNTTLNRYDQELLRDLTASSIDLYNQIKELGNILNRNYDDDNLRQIAVNLIAKLNGQYQYSSIEKYSLVQENTKPLRALNISNDGKIATGGESNILYVSSKNMTSGIAPLSRMSEFKSEINALEFLSENLIAVGLENSEVWLVELNSKENQKIFPPKKWKPGKLLGSGIREITELISVFQKDYFKGVGFIEYYKQNNILIASLEKSIVEIDFNKINRGEEEFIKSINLEGLSNDEFLTSMTLSEPYNTIFVATNKGNIILYDLNTKKEKILPNSILSLNDEKAIEIEFYEDKILIGTNEGSIYFYQLTRDKSFKLLGSQRTNFSKIKDILFNNDNIYSLSENGTLSIIPIANFKSDRMSNQVQIPVNISLELGNYGHAIEKFLYKGTQYFVTADHLGNLVYWDLNLENNFKEIERVYNEKFARDTL